MTQCAHCGKDQGAYIEETQGVDASVEFTYILQKTGTCTLPRDHIGPHVFIPDADLFGGSGV
jgi:hypothetical protein